MAANFLGIPNVDGPSDTRSQRRGSQSGGSKAGSHAGGSQSGRSRSGSTGQKQSPFPAGVGFDPALDDPSKTQSTNLRLDLPADAYCKITNRTPFTRRPGFNQSGKDIRVHVNQFRLKSISDYSVQQYDLTISPGGDKRGLIERIWKSSQIKRKLAEHKNGPWLFDGNKLVWSTNKVKEIRVTVDLGSEPGRRPSQDRDRDRFYFIMKHTGSINTNALRAYLEGKMDWDTSVLECVNFLDHALRQGPSERMHAVKRAFFPPNAATHRLNNATEAIKGIYAAIRMNQSINQGGMGLGVLVDVSHQTFFVSQNFESLVCEFIRNYDRKFRNVTLENLAGFLQPVKVKLSSGQEIWAKSDAFKALDKLRKMKFEVHHRGKTDDPKGYTVKGFTWQPKLLPDLTHAKNTTFDIKDRQTGVISHRSVYDHFVKQYNIRLRYWMLPLIETTRDGFFPLEVCHVKRYNRYPFKLDPDQTAAMIKFAVQRPEERKKDILTAVKALNWGEDPYLRNLKISIDPQMTMVQAKLLKNPEVQYSNGKVDPGTKGRWDLRGKKFVSPNSFPLKSWAFCVVDSSVDKPTLDNFVKVFTGVYQGHGGRIEKPPMVLSFPPRTDQGDLTFKFTPQIIFFILPDKTSWVYERLKKNADCRYACLSQMLQSMHVKKAQPQYCSNVCMKVNSKLGGQTSRIPIAGNSPTFKVPTLIIGCDVSHGPVGGDLPSMASLTVSMDKDAATYCANVQTNGIRREILNPSTIHFLLSDLVKHWCKKNGTAPSDVYYFRDGVSEGQFAHVMDMEVPIIKQVFQETAGKIPKLTVVVATKRHHVRFFPEFGDKNKNPLPGTLVEREVTHPFHYDFFLCSHSAIQGTARPVHYHVLHDEIKPGPDALQKMIYNQCYQYARSTTPVSLHPAVYYAHLASARAMAHVDRASSDQLPLEARPRALPAPGLAAKYDTSASVEDVHTESRPLLPMGGSEARPDAKEIFRHTMWFI
ncbi:Piwi-domain-containing protein [Thozetella sp. PMI_491]|nr:Piwi-domain-containing protein [Thozetella sp. PMI_491]